MKRIIGIIVMISLSSLAGKEQGQSASFNFSLHSWPASGWINVFGDPAHTVLTGTSPSGITVSSIATTNWAPSGVSAADGGGAHNGTFFPELVSIPPTKYIFL